jgi:CheY-like chemotaxis protein
MEIGIAPAFLVANNCQSLAEGSRKLLGGCEVHCNLSLKGHRLWRKRAPMPDDVPKKILMVDDDVGLLRIVREALTSCLVCEVDTSPNPEYGFELALKKSFDLFIFDFSMPMIDGAMLFFLIGKAYEHGNPPRVTPPLILISGKGEEVRAQELLKEPRVRGLVPKPFSINRLMEKLKQCLPDMRERS